jgi:hypothetical protein
LDVAFLVANAVIFALADAFFWTATVALDEEFF